MRRQVIVLGLLLLAGTRWYWRTPRADATYYSPDGYVARANQMIAGGMLSADCSTDTIQMRTDFSRASESDVAWFRDSYLATDVQLFNRDPVSFAWPFVIDETCVLRGVNPVAHRVELPFAQDDRWLGSLLYRNSADAHLRSADRTISLTSIAQVIPVAIQPTTAVGSLVGQRAAGSILFHYPRGPEQPAARVHFVGASVVVNNRSGPAGETVRLLGQQLRMGAIARLETGDWLHLESASPRSAETFAFVGGSMHEFASHVRIANDRPTRSTDDPALGRVFDVAAGRSHTLLDVTVQGIEAAIPRAADDDLRNFSVLLSIDRSLHTQMDTAFTAAVPWIPGQRLFPAAMTIMNAKTGELLALPTFPSQRLVRESRSGDARERRRLVQNQNLIAHPIGSAGKPLLYAAIVDAHPFLRGLVITGHGPERSRKDLLQCELPTGYRLLSDVGRIDLVTALETSSNEFTVTLGALALAAQRVGPDWQQLPLRAWIPEDSSVTWPRSGQASGITISGRPLNFAPALGKYLVYGGEAAKGSSASRRCEAMDRVEEAPFHQPLERIAAVPTYVGKAPVGLPDSTSNSVLDIGYRTANYDLRPWRPLVNHLQRDRDSIAVWQIRAAMQRMSPERVNLGLNQMKRLRADFINLLLGGGRSVWTNVQLAESFSRLVTGRDVEARLAIAVAPTEDMLQSQAFVRPADSIQFDPDARDAVLKGMQRVVEGSGTASALRDELRALRAAYPGDRVIMFAKTGSPSVWTPVERMADTLTKRLIGRRQLQLRGRSLVVASSGSGLTPYAPTGAPERPDFERALREAVRTSALGGSIEVLTRQLLRVADRFEQEVRSSQHPSMRDVDGPIVVEQGRLTVNLDDPFFSQRLIEGDGAVLTLTLVRVPKAAIMPDGFRSDIPTTSQMAHPDVRAITCVIYLATGPRSSVAVRVAKQLLPQLRALLD
jgi:cell division protein FtsI/penicillin-binding protein 2